MRGADAKDSRPPLSLQQAEADVCTPTPPSADPQLGIIACIVGSFYIGLYLGFACMPQWQWFYIALITVEVVPLMYIVSQVWTTAPQHSHPPQPNPALTPSE